MYYDIDNKYKITFSLQACRRTVTDQPFTDPSMILPP